MAKAKGGARAQGGLGGMIWRASVRKGFFGNSTPWMTVCRRGDSGVGSDPSRKTVAPSPASPPGPVAATET